MNLKSRWTAAAVVGVAVLSAAPAAHAQGVTNPAEHPVPVTVTIDGQTFTDGRDTLPGYDDEACTPIPGVQYDFAQGEILYYDSDGNLLKTAKWSEWARISSYQTWVSQQKTPTPTPAATVAPSTTATSTPAPSSGGTSNAAATAPSTQSATPQTQTTRSAATTKSPTTKTQTTKTQSTKTTSTAKSQSTKRSSSTGSSATTTASSTTAPSTSTASTKGSSNATSGASTGAGAGATPGATAASTPSSDASTSTAVGAAPPDPGSVDPAATGTPETTAGTVPGDPNVVTPAGTAAATGSGVVAGTASVVNDAAAPTYKLVADGVTGAPSRLAGVGILVALVALGFFCLAFGEVRQQLFGRRRRA
ncbi:hypothetical protein [Solirubrobacter pauli]|uniref:hypothetical protein n=1 Tax=Solirubrobacter pauli TaxID=166793 RepID=UPI0011C48293|nr:hypothetical protein [Solirubrobacter pauli]